MNLNKIISEMEFSNPASGNINRKIDKDELLRAIRLNIAAEHDAVALYTAQAQSTDNEIAKRILLDIADEERVHIGEFEKLIDILTDGRENELLHKGGEEVESSLRSED